VICLESDGSGMYTLQGLWTMARERLDVVTIVFNNRSYEILKGEFTHVGAGEPGRAARDLLEIGRPDLDWVKLANAQGVEASRAHTLDDLAGQLRDAVARSGPRLIELMM
jgi:acetolactate synthase-1/2/3 large subunit